MATAAKSPRIDQIIGANVRRLREGRGVSQDELARTARGKGLDWSRSTVAALEAGTKTLDVGELILLPLVVEAPIGELLASKGRISVGRAELAPGAVKRLLAGELGTLTVREVRTPDRARDVNRLEVEEDRQRFAMYDRLAPGIGLNQAVEAETSSRGDAEQQAARKLHVDAVLVAFASFGLWGHSLTEERERRLQALAGESMATRSLQALRGHVTRALLAELAPALEKGS